MIEKKRVGVSITKNIGNYESIKVSAEFEKEDEKVDWDELWKEVREQISKTVSTLIPPAAKNPEEEDDIPF